MVLQLSVLQLSVYTQTPMVSLSVSKHVWPLQQLLAHTSPGVVIITMQPSAVAIQLLAHTSPGVVFITMQPSAVAIGPVQLMLLETFPSTQSLSTAPIPLVHWRHLRASELPRAKMRSRKE